MICGLNPICQTVCGWGPRGDPPDKKHFLPPLSYHLEIHLSVYQVQSTLEEELKNDFDDASHDEFYFNCHGNVIVTNGVTKKLPEAIDSLSLMQGN